LLDKKKINKIFFNFNGRQQKSKMIFKENYTLVIIERLKNIFFSFFDRTILSLNSFCKINIKRSSENYKNK